jgi:hypothetical protein
MSRFRIHPAIGVARIGNSRDGFFVGPETAGLFANIEASGAFRSFRDVDGAILRQGARFRVFEYPDSGGPPREVVIAGDVVDIEWRVHLANRKASFFVFDGQNGADDLYLGRVAQPAGVQIKSDPDRTNLRNAGITGVARERLDIDPGEQLISKAINPGPVELSNPNAEIPIDSLGTLRLDDGGRLIVLGGRGQSASTATPPAQIDEYANNDTWFDDAGDGSVKARIRFSDGRVVDADAAWVIVGPPDFAPGIGNVVTLYDTLWDVAVREVAPLGGTAPSGAAALLAQQQAAWKASGGQTLVGFKPSFTRDVYPMLKRALAARHTHVSGIDSPHFHQRTFGDVGLLATLDPGKKEQADALRQMIFKRMRDPASNVVDWKGMPKGLGDDYTPLGNQEDPRPRTFLSLTRIQYAVLREWAAGNFVSDWPGAEEVIIATDVVTPDGLDQAAAENCVGGPFFPGIEVGWLIRLPQLYAEPFRLPVLPQPAADVSAPPLQVGALVFRPGFFSQQMALPWQADFYDCHKEREEDPDGNEHYFMWWTAHRPDDVFPSGSDDRVRWVRQFDDGLSPEEADGYYRHDRFTRMQQGWHKLRFVSVIRNGRFEEEP